MLTFTKAVAMLSRPHLITADVAAQYLPRLLGFDPRVARHSQPLELVARLAQRPDTGRANAMDDDDDDRSHGQVAAYPRARHRAAARDPRRGPFRERRSIL